MRCFHWYLAPLLAGMLAVTPMQAWGQPAAFFPGQAFCPPRTLVVGTIVMPQQQCFSVFLLRTPQSAFLGFVPAGLFFFPFGQFIGLRTSLGNLIRARILLLVPIAVPIFFVPVDTLHQEAFQVEDVSGTLGIRLAEDPATVVPITRTSPPTGASGVSATLSRIPLPADLHILPPRSDVPRDEAAFSGKWTGRWKTRGEGIADEGLPHILVIEQITHAEGFLRNETRVAGVFAWGRSSDLEVLPGWLRVQGVFERGILQLTLPGGVLATYRMAVDGTLDAAYASPDFGGMRATLSRTP